MAEFAEAGEKFDVGTVMSRTWSTLCMQPGAFLGMALVANVVQWALRTAFAFAAGTSVLYQGSMTSAVSGIVNNLLMLVFMVLFQGAITYAVFQIFMEGRASVGESVGRAWSRIPSLLFMAFLAAALVGALLVLPLLAMAFFFGVFFGFPLLAVVLLIIAIVILNVFYCKWYVAAPVCVVEKTGAVESFKRSSALTEGRRMKIYGMLILMLTVTGIITAVVNFIAVRTIASQYIRDLTVAIVNSAPMAFVDIMSTVVYYMLRVEKESLTATSLADIFD